MNRAALALLTCGAFLTLVLGVLDSGDPVPAMLLGAVFTVPTRTAASPSPRARSPRVPTVAWCAPGTD